jgi:hypothetical protein
VGVEPDIEVAMQERDELVSAEGSDQQPLRERDLEGHFRQEHADPAAEVAPGPSDAPQDVQLARGLEVLKSWSYFERLQEARQGALRAEASQPIPTP